MDYFLLYGVKEYLPPVHDRENAKWFRAGYGEMDDLIKELKSDKKLGFRGFQGAWLIDLPEDEDIPALAKNLDAYTIMVDDDLEDEELTEKAAFFFKSKQVRFVHFASNNQAFDWIESRLFGGQVGSKLDVSSMEVNPLFRGRVEFNGFENVRLSGNFGDEFWPVINWRWGMYCDKDRTLELWPQLFKDASVDIRLAVYENNPGIADNVRRRVLFTEADMKKWLLFEGTNPGSILNVSLEARGEGNLTMGNIHYRWSRRGLGAFIAGGEDLVDSKRDPLITYFNPGDLKPPLNIYFSGYRTAEGFEGFYMMRSMKAPFMLIGDPRLEGGAFYLGSQELQEKLVARIQEKMDWLGFDHHQVTMSGLSMGTFGALYYGSKIEPGAIVVGKPLASLGKMAQMERDYRYGIFPTALDVLNAASPDDNWRGDFDERAKALDDMFWTAFDKADFSRTTLAIAYMADDDYDPHAYQDIMRSFSRCKQDSKIIAKGFPGHHNDATGPLVKWFRTQYGAILKDEFGR